MRLDHPQLQAGKSLTFPYGPRLGSELPMSRRMGSVGLQDLALDIFITPRQWPYMRHKEGPAAIVLLTTQT